MNNYKEDGLFGIKITRRISDDFINASLICKNHGTTFEDWMQSRFAIEFLEQFFATTDYRYRDVIDYSDNAYFVSQFLMAGLCSSLSETFYTNFLRWGRKEAIKAQPLQFSYTVESTKTGTHRQNMIFYPVRGVHTMQDVQRERATAAQEARNVQMGFVSRVSWITHPGEI